MSDDNETKSELDLGEPPQYLKDWAKENIREDPSTRCQMVADLRDLIYSRGECTPHRTDDAFLLRFLRGRNFVMEQAYRLFVNYYEFKENYPEIFEDVSFDLLNRIGDNDLINVPPYREQTGRRMMIYRIGVWSPEIFTTDEVLRASLFILELAILEARAQILGGICIVDLENLTMQQAWYMNPSIAHKVFQIMVTSFPMKVHALHVVHQPWMFDMLFNFFKPFLNEKMKERIFFHGDDMGSLHKHIDPKHLPERYGGIHKNYSYNDWISGFKRNPIIIEEMQALEYRVD